MYSVLPLKLGVTGITSSPSLKHLTPLTFFICLTIHTFLTICANRKLHKVTLKLF
jgi:hypothetical protein